MNGKIEIEKTSLKFLDKKLEYLSDKKGFLGVDNKFNFKEKVIIVPFGLEKTVSYGKGTKNGPKEIIKASHQVELYDEEFNCEPYKKIGIKTLKPFKIDKDITKALKKMSNINKVILDKKLFPMTFGGEHSITPGCIDPFVKKYKKICLLHFDAHADLRDSYNGEKFSHASAIRRCLDFKNVSIISFGKEKLQSLENNEKESTVNSAMAKRYATDVCFEICNEALQIHGGYGYLKDFGIEKIVRDLRVHEILEGTNEIMQLIIARRILN